MSGAPRQASRLGPGRQESRAGTTSSARVRGGMLRPTQRGCPGTWSTRLGPTSTATGGGRCAGSRRARAFAGQHQTKAQSVLVTGQRDPVAPLPRYSKLAPGQGRNGSYPISTSIASSRYASIRYGIPVTSAHSRVSDMISFRLIAGTLKHLAPAMSCCRPTLSFST